MSKKTILVQAGHLAPRDPNHLAQTGTAGEIGLVRQIRDMLVARLNADGRFHALPFPGYIPTGTRCDAALFLHADGSGSQSASGFSLGYPEYAVNRKLANLIRDEFLKVPGHPPHHRDNYTRDMSGYYGFNRADTAGPEVLVEHGFLTNPSERYWLLGHVAELAEAEYQALCRYFGYTNSDGKGEPPAWWVKYLPRNKADRPKFFAALREQARRLGRKP